MERIKEILKAQTETMLYLNSFTTLLEDCHYRIDNQHILGKHLSVQILHKIVWNETILCLYKLINDSDYSLKKCNEILNRDFKHLDLSEINTSFKEINRLYKNNKINEIRNQYVAHLLKNRTSQKYKWKDIFEFGKLILHYHNKVRIISGMNSTMHIIRDENLLYLLDGLEILLNIRKERTKRAYTGVKTIAFDEISQMQLDITKLRKDYRTNDN